ncbi:hypothetical protein [Oceanicaulis sp. MMSF_3324]|uniref:hypothetical protein n=1 Tax=Oceanicaulis sp. MMSF_3324 TaxID=3046702 RepID=UPI00273E64BC|nr:hypothetical protein [Oceanicaulis sp. MMSF_3324]
MTARFRFWLAAIACLVALFSGWLTSVSQNDTPPTGRRAGLAIPQLTASTDIDRYVQAVFDSNLFPDVELREDATAATAAGGPQTVEELEQSLRDPSLSALVKREDAWRIILYGVREGAQMREVGDQLSDGWVIQNIDSTTVLLIKGEQTRRIEVFKAEPDTQ